MDQSQFKSLQQSFENIETRLENMNQTVRPLVLLVGLLWLTVLAIGIWMIRHWPANAN